MGFEKHGSKSGGGGGGYVGGFFQIFDWNGRSRKKLFSNKSDKPERMKQGKRSDGNLPTTRFRLIEEEESVGGSSIKGSSDYSYASSMTDEEGYRTRPPGVVARLMGLDSMPTFNVDESYSTPFFDSRSLQDAHYQRRTPNFHNDHQITHSSNFPNRMEVFSRNPVESRPQKMHNNPIERFQTEILPPKSAKSIPITHHKLFSPIKNHGFIPAKDAAHIMEAAAKIIEAEPQASTKCRMPSVGPSSVPLRVRDLKEKMEAAQRPSRRAEVSRSSTESNAVKYLKGQSLNKSWNSSEDTPQLRASLDSEESNSVDLKKKGKSISLAIQAKVNVQRRESLSSSSKSLLAQKEHNGLKSNQPLKSQSSTQKITQKKSSTRSTSNVLRQNNQKQNCPTNKDKPPSKALVSNQQGSKPLSGEVSFGQNKTWNKVTENSKIRSRKTGSEAIDIEKEVPPAKTKNFSRKKRSINGDFHLQKNGVVDTDLVCKNEKPILSNIPRDGHVRVEDSRKKGMDVVSFTFTSPMKKIMPDSESSSQTVEKKTSFCVDYRSENIPSDAKSTKLTSMGLNAIGSDALSILLERKLRELTYGVESSSHKSVKAGTVSNSASILQDLVSALNAVKTIPREPYKKMQGLERIRECSSDNTEDRKELDCRHPSPISILEASFSKESCNSSDSVNSSSTDGSKQRLSVHAQELISLRRSNKFQSMETEIELELSDSASSTSIGTAGRKHVTTFSMTDPTRSDKWELEYVGEILCNVELMFKDFASGRVRKIINTHLFDQLENRKIGSISDGEEKYSRLRRKVLFDCVSECLNLRCSRYASGGFRTWVKGVATVRRKEWLAEEVYKEILEWRSMGDWMVDELVEKDMSSQYGRWLDFDIETFEVGVEIESGVLSSLIDEVVTDIILG